MKVYPYADLKFFSKKGENKKDIAISGRRPSEGMANARKLAMSFLFTIPDLYPLKNFQIG
ncbi:hypothetical protein [Pedobacter sp. WC2423]|uniref:hypothetical protein n=1 Tax=Pedobacter sp. WC2423 TaxID=3234142 RepID=UPI003465D0DF